MTTQRNTDFSITAIMHNHGKINSACQLSVQSQHQSLIQHQVSSHLDQKHVIDYAISRDRQVTKSIDQIHVVNNDDSNYNNRTQNKIDQHVKSDAAQCNVDNSDNDVDDDVVGDIDVVSTDADDEYDEHDHEEVDMTTQFDNNNQSHSRSSSSSRSSLLSRSVASSRAHTPCQQPSNSTTISAPTLNMAPSLLPHQIINIMSTATATTNEPTNSQQTTNEFFTDNNTDYHALLNQLSPWFMAFPQMAQYLCSSAQIQAQAQAQQATANSILQSLPIGSSGPPLGALPRLMPANLSNVLGAAPPFALPFSNNVSNNNTNERRSSAGDGNNVDSVSNRNRNVDNQHVQHQSSVKCAPVSGDELLRRKMLINNIHNNNSNKNTVGDGTNKNSLQIQQQQSSLLQQQQQQQPAAGAPTFPSLRLAPASLSYEEDNQKPAHSYIGLIAMCILSTPDKRMVLNDIYKFITDHYAYFRNRGNGWKNSIRHNLSLNDCFMKCARAANGKGHYWSIHPANMDDFMRGDFRRRRAQRKVRRHMGLHVPSDESDDESDDDAAKPPLPEHFKRSIAYHRRIEQRIEQHTHSAPSITTAVATTTTTMPIKDNQCSLQTPTISFDRLAPHHIDRDSSSSYHHRLMAAQQQPPCYSHVLNNNKRASPPISPFNSSVDPSMATASVASIIGSNRHSSKAHSHNNSQQQQQQQQQILTNNSTTIMGTANHINRLISWSIDRLIEHRRQL